MFVITLGSHLNHSMAFVRQKSDCLRVYFKDHFVIGHFRRSLVPLFQSESKCEIILMKMTFINMKNKLRAELALILGFKKRHKRTPKWPISAPKSTLQRVVVRCTSLHRVTPLCVRIQ